MTRKLTRAFKERICRRCANCNLEALRQGKNHCNSIFKSNGESCENFAHPAEEKV